MYEIWTKDEYGIRIVVVFFDGWDTARFLGLSEHPWDYLVQYV